VTNTLTDETTLCLVWLSVDELQPNEWNSNQMTKPQREALRRSIERDGFVQPVAVRPLDPATSEVAEPVPWAAWWAESEGGRTLGSLAAWAWQVIDGAHRLQAAVDLGYREVPCVALLVGEAEARRISETLNLVHGRPVPELLGDNLRAMLELGMEKSDISALTALTIPRIEELTLLPIDLPDMEVPEAEEGDDPDTWHELVFNLNGPMLATVRRALEAAKRIGQTQSDAQALEYLCSDFLSGADTRSYE
jgi:ParB-like chromosome segregation protein Spo0J